MRGNVEGFGRYRVLAPAFLYPSARVSFQRQRLKGEEMYIGIGTLILIIILVVLLT